VQEDAVAGANQRQQLSKTVSYSVRVVQCLLELALLHNTVPIGIWDIAGAQFPACAGYGSCCAGPVHVLQVVDTETGEFKVDKVRTSSGFFLKRGQTEVVKRLEHRIAEWTRLPVVNGEPLHVLRYQVRSMSLNVVCQT
jgi:hypothetical protein